MAKYTGSYAGSWAKGFASTFSQAPSMIFQALQWKEKKKEKEKIDKAAEEFKINIANFANKIDETFKDGTVTQQEYSDMVGFGTVLGSEYLKEWEDIYKNYIDMSSQEIDSQLDTINFAWDKWTTLGMGNPESFMGVLDDIGKSTKYPKVKTQVDYLKNMINNRGQQPEGFNSPEELLKVHPGADWEFNSSLKKYIVKQITGPRTAGISDYNSAATYLSKFVNSPLDVFNKEKASIQNKFGIDVSNITQESLREPVSGGTEKPRVTSLPQLEEYRTKALDADTWEDAEKVINDYTNAGYDASQIGVTKEAWVNSQKEYLNKTLQAIKNIVDEKGLLKKGDFTQEQVGLVFDGKRTAEEIYQELVKSYLEYIDKLQAMGIDISQFPKLRTFEEYKKSDTKSRKILYPSTWGSQNSIYY